ncbi:MAG: IS5 family transposase [Rivihabitans pingtungensis]
MENRKPYPSDVSDEECMPVAPYLTVSTGQRKHSLREVFNAVRYVVRCGCPWRMLPNDLPPWSLVYQQMQRWLKAGCFEEMVHDLRVLRLVDGCKAHPSAAIIDSRTIQSTPSSTGTGYDGAKRKKGVKVHMAVDTLGHLLALHVTPADEQDRRQVGKLVQAVQEETCSSVKIAFVDQGYTGDTAANEAGEHGVELHVVKLPEAKRGFVLLPRRWVVERSFGWAACLGVWPESHEKLPQTLAFNCNMAFAMPMLPHLPDVIGMVQNMLYTTSRFMR